MDDRSVGELEGNGSGDKPLDEMNLLSDVRGVVSFSLNAGNDMLRL